MSCFTNLVGSLLIGFILKIISIYCLVPFYDFLRDFNLKNGKANFANVEMKIKLLRLY